MTSRWRAVAWGALGVIAVVALWELYKWAGPADGVVIGSERDGLRILPRTHDRAMPHVWVMIARLFEATSGASTPPLWLTVVGGMVTTLGIAAVGWVIGVVVGMLFALLMQRWRLAEWGLLPWIVVSQTVPLIAFAPLVSRIGSQIDRNVIPWPDWLSVAIIASYLAFFPVAVGALRGLSSPDAIHSDLMRSYGASYLQTLRQLRLPAAVPYLLPALRLAAANAVVGAVVAEVSIGMRGGLGRMLLQMAQSASADPALPWAPIFGAVVLGLVAAGSVALLGATLTKYRRGEATA
ncbi:NitT/TauT family transport system permease protein [Microbacterium halimionae]|uniref:NitT/TauT family transport system permease protein n=1 Tax=Microbacterium halimionae TaxID=1526413 RepID=A0A7W3PN68_9MICO|nr:ABC transporter permease subunit [Microbacterium halimionae]MBA8817649.1 NitT/TauT family transport system permease protein [Microbacterium halimionae]NII94772.1 NitT/TauT family transport system permease protein [Microbacterium halimionae]